LFYLKGTHEGFAVYVILCTFIPAYGKIFRLSLAVLAKTTTYPKCSSL